MTDTPSATAIEIITLFLVFTFGAQTNVQCLAWIIGGAVGAILLAVVAFVAVGIWVGGHGDSGSVD